jgi:hypothetical protein
MKQKSTMSSLFGSKSKVKAIEGGRLKVVKSETVPGKCSTISDGDWTVFPNIILHQSLILELKFYLLINLFDDSIKKNTSTLMPVVTTLPSFFSFFFCSFAKTTHVRFVPVGNHLGNAL